MEPKKILAVSQLVSALSDAIEKLEAHYNEKDFEHFKKAKEEILIIQERISKVLKERAAV